MTLGPLLLAASGLMPLSLSREEAVDEKIGAAILLILLQVPLKVMREDEGGGGRLRLRLK